jgi:Skp family chaperone for outer membrane proteins
MGVAAGLVFATAIYVTAAPAGAPPAPARVGVVDFAKLLKDYARMKDAEKSMSDAQTRIRDEAKALMTEVETLKAKIQMHTPGSEAYAATEKEILAKSGEFERWKQAKASEVLARERTIIREVFTDVERAAAQYAKDNGFTLILKSDKLDLSSPSVRELDFRVTLKQILYAADEMDITDALTGILNARYGKPREADKAAAPK